MADDALSDYTGSVIPDGDKVAAIRKLRGLTQEDLAKKTGCNKRTVENIEASKSVKASSLREVAEALEVDFQDLLNEECKSRLLSPILSPNRRNPAGSTSATPQSAALPIRSLFQLPASLTDFVGRKEQFEKIVARLSGVGGKVWLSALRGMGGIGKTSLAVLAAHAVKEHYPDAQLFLELRGVSDAPVTAVEAMSRVIRDFHPETGKLPDTEAELLPLYRSVLNGKRALIVLDNAKDESQVKPLLSAGPPVAFLITSRNALMLDGVEGVRLDVLPPQEAFTLLRDIVGTKGTDAELQTVAELCGRLPLALRVAGGYLATFEDCEVDDYIKDLKAFGLEQLKKEVTDDDKKVELVLSHSAKMLVIDNPERAERWQALSVFPANFDIAAAAAVWEIIDPATTDELRALSRRSLLDCDKSTHRYGLHDLMRPIARDAFEYVDSHPLQTGVGERIRTAERRFARHYCTVLSAADYLYQQGNDHILIGLALFDLEAANIRYGWKWTTGNRDNEPLAVELCRDYPNAGVYVTNLRLPANERIVWLHASLEACRKLKDRHGEKATLANLGTAHDDLGDARTAISFHEQALKVCGELGDRRTQGSVLGCLGNAHRSLGDTSAAITFHERQLVIAREVGDRRGEGMALGSLGAAHFTLGDASTAITFSMQHLAIAREIGDRRGEGMALGGLGIAHAALGDARTAITFHEQRLMIAREIGDQRGEGNATFNMSLALDSLGQRDDAIRHAANALAIWEAIGHPGVETVLRLFAEWRGEA